MRKGPSGSRGIDAGRWVRGVLATGALAFGIAAAAGPRAREADPNGDDFDFARDVRPILAQSCFPCHGPDGERRQAGLRLDTREGLFADLDGARVVAPGDLGASELFYRITARDPDERMPPSDAGEALEPEQVEAIERWIEAGAPWSRHWSFVAPEEPDLPAVPDPSWARDPIDLFALARLEGEGLAPSPEADRATLLRRLSFDLTGLPPTIEELDAFLADPDEDAYERVVDRLLASPRYGERMALAWLDLARYADTNGYSIDGGRHMWAWRDWVIDAFDRNMPFDRFTVEQLAGDLLPGATLEQRVASGFNRNHAITHEGGTIEEEYRVAYVVDRVKTTAQTWMGLTLGCAQCHDHKYDPVSQEEYYRFFAYFNTITDRGNDGNGGVNSVPFIAVPSEVQWAELAPLKEELAAAREELAVAAGADTEQADWERELLAHERSGVRPELGHWHVAGPYRGQTGDEAYAVAYAPEQADTDPIDWQPRPDLADGTAHALSGEVAATYLARTITTDAPRIVRISLGSDDAIKVWLDGENLLENRVQRGVAPNQERLALHLHEGENRLLVKIVNYGGPAGFYFAVSQVGPGPAVLRILNTPAADRTAEEAESLSLYYRFNAPRFRPIRDRIAHLRRRIAAIEDSAATTVMVMEEMAVPRDTFVLERGQYDAPRQKVEVGTPSCLPPLPAGTSSDRLGLARWLVDPAHPLTGRVAVNTFWQMLFGAGLVETAEDFGTRGSPPSHPRLLDHLALGFVASGWDVKALIRRIVTSATYRQSSRITPELLERDPENRLLARGARFRLQAEMVRDNALAVSGLLVERLGGPSVKPYQPPGLWREMSHFGSTPATEQVYEQGSGEDLYRRSMYTVLKRTVPPPAMAAFDAPNRELCTSRRSRTNTPLQALVTMNDPTFVEAARALAGRMLTEGGRTPRDRIRFAFRLATAHEPSLAELAVLLSAYERELAVYGADREAALELLDVGDSPRDETLDPSEHAAWTIVASTLLNLSRTMTRD